MSIYNIIGVIMLVIFFGGLFIYIGKEMGWKNAFAIYSGTVVLTTFIYVACKLLAM